MLLLLTNVLLNGNFVDALIDWKVLMRENFRVDIVHPNVERVSLVWNFALSFCKSCKLWPGALDIADSVAGSKRVLTMLTHGWSLSPDVGPWCWCRETTRCSVGFSLSRCIAMGLHISCKASKFEGHLWHRGLDLNFLDLYYNQPMMTDSMNQFHR